MKSVLMSIRLYYFYCTYKGIKTKEIRKKFPLNYKGKIYEYVSKTNWKQDLMKIPAKERDFFKQFVGKIGLCFECDKVEEIKFINPNRTCGFSCEISDDDCYYNINEKECCLSQDDLYDYLQGKNGYAIHITKLEIFNKPKEISEFYLAFSYDGGKPFINTYTNSLVHRVEINGKSEYESVSHLTRAPQSWCYIEV